MPYIRILGHGVAKQLIFTSFSPSRIGQLKPKSVTHCTLCLLKTPSALSQLRSRCDIALLPRLHYCPISKTQGQIPRSFGKEMSGAIYPLNENSSGSIRSRREHWGRLELRHHTPPPLVWRRGDSGSFRSLMVHSFCGFTLPEVSFNLTLETVSLQLAGNTRVKT